MYDCLIRDEIVMERYQYIVSINCLYYVLLVPLVFSTLIRVRSTSEVILSWNGISTNNPRYLRQTIFSKLAATRRPRAVRLVEECFCFVPNNYLPHSYAVIIPN